VINTVEQPSRTLNVTHEPIPELNWPAMTMDFPAAKGVKLEGLKPDSQARFRLREGDDGRYVIDAIEPAKTRP
jgi:Cu/Ag efflux protein CusF